VILSAVFRPRSPRRMVTHMASVKVHRCVKRTRSKTTGYKSKTAIVRLRFMFHYGIPPARRPTSPAHFYPRRDSGCDSWTSSNAAGALRFFASATMPSKVFSVIGWPIATGFNRLMSSSRTPVISVSSALG